MHKLSLLLLATFATVSISFAQLSGTKTIPGDYASVAAAVTDLNAQGVGAGGVTFNVAAGHTETIAAVISITATGTLANPIIFQKAGAGANPVITSYTGGTGTPGSAVQDGIWRLVGSDYVTIDGISLAENAANTTNPSTMEYGFALYKTSLSDGAQNNTIRNCTITLNRINNAAATAPMQDGSIGIYVGNSTEAAATTALTPTTAAGTNSNNKFYSNTIQNCNIGIGLSGFAAATPFTAGDTGNDIGGASAATGNTILNYGGAPAAANPAAGIRANNQWGINISNNTVNNNNGAGVNHATILRGIYAQAGTSANATISNNTITVNSGATTVVLTAIENGIGSTAASNTVSINGNTIQNCTYSTATTGAFNAILSSSTAATVNLNNNIVSNNIIPGTGDFLGIYNSGTSTTVNMNNNQVTGNQKTGANGTMYCLRIGTSFAVISGNTVNNNSAPSTSGTTATSIFGIYSLASATSEVFTNNTITNLSIGGAGTAAAHTINGIRTNTVAASVKDMSGNTIQGLSVTATGGSGVVAGISTTLGNTITIAKNKIGNLSGDGASGTSTGILIVSGTTINIINNLIGDLRAPSASAADVIRGIASTSTTATSSINVYYNSIYLNATSTGTTFGTSGIFHTINATATTAALNMRNNIIVNTSVANGTGVTAAYRRSSATLTNYANTSNNNLFYAGVPGAANLIFYDGTNSDQLLSAYKARVTPRDGFSVTENPSFLGTVVANANFLHINTAVATQVESGAAPIAGVTDDYDADARNATAPDIGADEFAGTPSASMVYVSSNAVQQTGVAYIGTANQAILRLDVVTTGTSTPLVATNFTLNANGSSNIADLSSAKIYYTGLTPTFSTANLYGSATPTLANYTVSGSQVLNEGTNYFWVAYDVTAGATGGNTIDGEFVDITTSAALHSPTTAAPAGNKLIAGAMSGNYNIGSAQVFPNFATITAAVNDLTLRGIGGAVTFTLLDANYSTAETFPITIGAVTGLSASNTVTFKPGSGVTSVITGSPSNIFLFRVLGNYVTFDGSNTVGGTTRDLTVTNTAATSPASFLFGSTGTTPVINGTLKNLILINGVNTTSNIVVGSATSTPASGAAGYFNNITIQNISSQKTNHGVYMQAVVAAGNGSGTLVTGNDFAPVGANANKQSGVTLIGIDGAVVSNNTIGNFDQTTAEIDKGVWLQTGTINTTVSGNTITNLGYNGTSASGNAYGIWVQTANATSNVLITGNNISGFSSSGPATTVGTSGIFVSLATAGVTIEKNRISNIKNTNVNGHGSNGIQLSSTSTTANTMVRNNMITDIASYGFPEGGADDNGYGIVINAGAGYSIYYNTIHLNTNQTATDGWPAALNVTSAVTAAGAIDVRNNIFSNSQTVGTDRYAIYSAAPNTVFSNIDYNDYYSAGPNIGFIGSNRAALADIQTGFGGNANSKNIMPVFVSTTDLHLNVTSNALLDGAATPIGGTTTDIDGDTRNVTTPDMGADEFTFVVGIDMALTTLVTPAVTSCYSAAETVTVRIQNTSSTLVDFTANPATVNVAVTGAATANFSTNINTGTLAPGATQDVVLPGTLNMGALGVYTFKGKVIVASDVNAGNDSLPTVTRTAAITGGTPAATPRSYCVTAGTPTVTLTGSTGGTIQWQEGPSATGPWTNVGTNSTTYTPAAAITATTFYRATTTCGINSVSGTVDSVTYSNPQILTTTPGGRCGTGTVNLAATATAGATISWYAASTGGTPLGTGPSFTTPSISSNTTYYVGAGTGTSASVGAPNNGNTSGYTLEAGLIFSVIAPSVTINGVYIYPVGTGAGVVNIALKTSGGATLQSIAFNCTGTTAPGIKTFVPLNWVVPAGTAYVLDLISRTGNVASLTRDGAADITGGGYPFTLPGALTITSGQLSGSGTSTSYYFFYDWQVTTGCESARTAVLASTDQCGTIYTFSGNGLWSNPANWAGGLVPPSTLPAGSEVKVDPTDGDCILDVPFTVAFGGTLTVMPGKNLIVQGNLIRQ